jgi:protein SCO1
MRQNRLVQAGVLGGLLFFAASHAPGLFGESATNAPGSVAHRPRKRSPLLDYKFTNELGQAVSISDFHGQALAITFFFTRCPMPEFCPRLSKNFQEASRKLSASDAGFTNWHFLSITFDPVVDTPAVLQAYAERYEYDPRHWSFLTGPEDKIREFARLSGVKADPDNGLINHNFRTLIIDATNHLQMVFPMGGDLSEAIVTEMRKAGAVALK